MNSTIRHFSGHLMNEVLDHKRFILNNRELFFSRKTEHFHVKEKNLTENFHTAEEEEDRISSKNFFLQFFFFPLHFFFLFFPSPLPDDRTLLKFSFSKNRFQNLKKKKKLFSDCFFCKKMNENAESSSPPFQGMLILQKSFLVCFSPRSELESDGDLEKFYLPFL